MSSSLLRSGVFAAALTPLNDTLEPDLTALTGHARWLLTNGCDGVALLGTTGEANSLSVAQRLAIIETAENTLPPDQTIIGTGCAAIADTVTLTRAALSAGFAHVLMLPPFYYKNVSDDGVYRAYAEIIDRIGDASLRVYIYHFPQMSAVPVSIDVIRRLIGSYGKTIAGVKDSSGEWSYTAALLKEFPDLATFSGSERFLLDNLRAGGPGCISATTNVDAPLAHAVFANWQSVEAGALQDRLTAVRLALQAFPAIPSLKYLTRCRTGDDVWQNMLPPLVDLDASQRETLLAQLRDLGFYDAVPQMKPEAA